MDDDRHGLPEDPPELDSSTAEPPEFGEARHSVLTPAGEIESTGAFARGLGPRRVKVALFVGCGLIFLIALVATIRP